MKTTTLFCLLVGTALISGCATLYEKPDPVVGQWEFELPGTPQGDLEGTLTIHKEDGVYSGFLTPRSTRNYLSVASEILKFAVQKRYLFRSPIDYLTDVDRKELCGVSKFREPSILTVDEATCLLNTALQLEDQFFSAGQALEGIESGCGGSLYRLGV